MVNRFDDLDDRWNLPSWIPAWLLAAERAKIWEKTKAIVEKKPEEEQRILEAAKRAPQNSISTLLNFLWFKKTKNSVYPDFFWKNVLDIWGGFWWVAPNLSFSASEIIVADPSFRQENISEMLEKEVKWQNEVIRLRTNFFVKNPNKLNVKEDIEEAENVLQDLTWWQREYTKERYPHIRRNISYWENLMWIDDNSQDYVFLNYVLSKETVEFEKVINEVKRVLKKGWKLIVSDYHMEDKVLNYIESLFDVDIREDDKRVIFIAIKK